MCAEESMAGTGLSRADVTVRPFELMAVVCSTGGVSCPLVEPKRVEELQAALKDPCCRIRFETDADEVPYFGWPGFAGDDPGTIQNRKRDLDILQRLGQTPGATTRSRFVIEQLFRQIEAPAGICAWDTPGWEGCPHAQSGAYESVREKGARAIVEIADSDEVARRKVQAARAIRDADHLYIQSHILMCICCHYAGGEGDTPRKMDELYELRIKMQENPEIPVTIVDGDLCMVCGSCDGANRTSHRCVHAGGLIRQFKKNLDVLQMLGLMPGATLPARELYALLLERIPSTKLICSFKDGIVTSPEWAICGGPDGNPGYEKTVAAPFI